MVSLSWIDCYYLVKEFKQTLLGARIDTFYGTRDELHIKLYKAGMKNSFVSSYISKGITVLHNQKSEHNPKNNFVQYLRKYIKNGFIDDIISYEKERTITFVISKKEKEETAPRKYYLFFEHFLGGQITLCDEKFTILKSLKSKPLLSKSLMSKSSNEESQENQDTQKDFTHYSLKSSQSLLSHFELDSSQTLQDSVKQLGIGKKYLEVIALLHNITPKTRLKDADMKTNIENDIQSLLQHDLRPSTFHLNSIVYIIPFVCDKNSSKLHNCTYSQLLFEHYKDELVTSQNSQEPAKLIKLKKRLQDQEKHLAQINTKCDILQQQGSVFYEEYELLKSLQENIKTIVTQKGFKELKVKIKENNTLKKIVCGVDEREQKVTINMEELKKFRGV